MTYQGRPFALLGPASSWTELDELFADVPTPTEPPADEHGTVATTY